MRHRAFFQSAVSRGPSAAVQCTDAAGRFLLVVFKNAGNVPLQLADTCHI